MIRKLLLPALLTGLLAGCVTDYSYRDGYYYGQPGVEYRYHYDYGYPGWYGYYPYEHYRYYNTYPYYGYPYYGYPYRYQNHDYYRRRHHDDQSQSPISQFPIHRDTDSQPRHESRPPPWRNPDNVGRTDPPRRQWPNTPPPNMPAPTPRTHPDHDGSVIGQMMRRNQQQQRHKGERGETHEP